MTPAPPHYEHCDIPSGMTLEEYRRSRRRPRRGSRTARLLKRLRRRRASG